MADCEPAWSVLSETNRVEVLDAAETLLDSFIEDKRMETYLCLAYGGLKRVGAVAVEREKKADAVGGQRHMWGAEAEGYQTHGPSVMCHRSFQKIEAADAFTHLVFVRVWLQRW